MPWLYQKTAGSCDSFNTLRPRQNGRHFADDNFKCIFLNENTSISINISLKFVPEGRINNIPALVQIMAWRRLGDKPLSEPMMISLLTHICVTRPQWVKAAFSIIAVSQMNQLIYFVWNCKWYMCNSLPRPKANLIQRRNLRTFAFNTSYFHVFLKSLKLYQLYMVIVQIYICSLVRILISVIKITRSNGSIWLWRYSKYVEGIFYTDADPWSSEIHHLFRSSAIMA